MPIAALLLGSVLGVLIQEPTVTLQGTVRPERAAAGSRVVELRRLAVQDSGRVQELDLLALYERAADVRLFADQEGSFTAEVAAGAWSVFAFADVDGDGHWSPAVPEPCAWLPRLDAGPDAPPLAVLLTAPRPLPRQDRRVAHGALRWLRGYPVVQLAGDAAQRGRAHGELLAEQIVDFFRFYVLEEQHGGTERYGRLAAFLESHFAWPAAMLEEVDGVFAGMRASGADLRLPELGRELTRTDLLAINAYIETRAMRASCTQFACWGERTAGTDVAGGTIAGRNMDGEIDLRRVTVSHFVLFAVAPAEPGHKRYVSMMWPGFVGTLSGFNEDGVHCMENAGGTGPGPVVEALQPVSWTMRQALATFDGKATPQDFERLLGAHANAAGGACGPGCIIVFALPKDAPVPAWVLEGDRFGHRTRLPGAVPPRLTDAVLASNHHLAYGVGDRPGRSFGREPAPSSRWRYEAGQHRLEGWLRSGRKVGTAEMKELLQITAHGTTEHSVITRPDAREFEVAVASMAPEPWDAPYRAWTRFSFAEVFEGVPQARAGDR